MGLMQMLVVTPTNRWEKNGLAVRLHQSGNALFLHMQVTHIHNTRGAVGLLPAATKGFPVLRLSLSLPVEYLDVD